MPLLLLILALIHTMMQDMMQGQADGYYDGIENIRGDSYDDACRYRERKGRNMSWGMKKDMMPASMMALLIVTMIQRRKSSGFT